jgi:uncharacterized DUF497 family protein
MKLFFEWDQRKAARNQTKHGVSFDEARSVFGDPLLLLISDPDHSEDEERFIAIGESREKRLLIVVASELNQDWIRLISARKATNTERSTYERR